jgi:quercetin dioxygenase-like cupin family protein
MGFQTSEAQPCTVIKWASVEQVRQPGTSGDSFWRTVELQGLRLRVVEYPPKYLADHWCTRGHVLHLLAGEIAVNISDGAVWQLQRGMTCHLAPGFEHQLRTVGDQTAVVLIVD